MLEHGRVPTSDPFSYTREGAEWTSHEWGFGLLCALAHGFGGLRGLVVLKAAASGLLFALIFWSCIRRLPARPSRWLLACTGALVLAGVWAGGEQLILRASLLSSALLATELLILDAFERTGRRRHLVAVVVLFVAWANLHSGVLFGVIALGLWILEPVAGAVTGGRGFLGLRLDARGSALTYLATFAAGLLACLINPSGVGALTYAPRIVLFFLEVEAELDFGHYTAVELHEAAGFYGVVALLLASLLPRSQWRRLRLSEVLLVGFFLVLAVRGVRFSLHFLVVALPWIVKLNHERVEILGRWLASEGRLRWRQVLGWAVLVAVVGAVSGSAVEHRSAALIADHLPKGAARFLASQGISGRMFNHQNYGGYLGWALGTQVFWDGRSLVFKTLMEEADRAPLEEMVERYQFDHLVIAEHEFRTLSPQLDGSRWGLVYWDDFSAVFLRRIPSYQGVLEAHELRWLPPFGGVPALGRLANDPVLAVAVRDELDRLLSLEPRNQRALYFSARIRAYQGDFAGAVNELTEAAEIRPNRQVLEALADALDRVGRPSAAARARRRAAGI